MVCLGVELRLFCRACDAPIALNAVVPRVQCDRCLRPVELPAPLWARLLADLVAAGAEMKEQEQRDTPFDSEAGLIRRVYRRGPPTCQACNTPVDRAAVDKYAPHGWIPCGRCGRNLAIRRHPQITPEVLHYLGEEPELMYGRTARPPEAIQIPCPQCSAPLRADGQSRVVNCGYCRTQSHLPDDIWARLHPIRPVQRFYLLLPEAKQVDLAQMEMPRARAAIAGPDGNLYLAGEDAVYSLDPYLRPRWVRADLGAEAIALVAGRIVIYSHEGGRVRLLSPESGADAPGTFAMPEDGECLVGDANGTAICVVGQPGTERHVVRVDASGQQIPLFDKGAGKPGIFDRIFGGAEDSDYVTLPGWGGGSATPLPGGGMAYIAVHDTDHVECRAHDRQGALLWRTRIDLAWNDFYRRRMQADGHGRLYYLSWSSNQLVRLSAQGLEVVLPKADGYGALAVLPSGELWLFEDDEARRYDPAGRLVFANEAARQADRERLLDQE